MNNVTVFGNLTKDPETRNGNPSITRFTLADNYGKGENAGVNYWNVTMFGKAGECVGTYTKKGDALIVYGTMKTNHYTDKDGNKHEYTELIANGFAFTGKKEKEDAAPVPETENPFGTK